MGEKTPRLKPHHVTISELSRVGSEMYHQRRVLSPIKARRIGQLSITEGTSIIKENQDVQNGQ